MFLKIQDLNLVALGHVPVGLGEEPGPLMCGAVTTIVL
jgi:hypothetical protein